jgi:hypothetical protein
VLEKDYIEIQDRKSHLTKGVFIPDSYAKEVVTYLTEKINRERMLKKNSLLSYAGIATGDYGEESYIDLAAEKSGKYGD